jgi:hypothetical protein
MKRLPTINIIKEKKGHHVSCASPLGMGWYVSQWFATIIVANSQKLTS